LTPWATNRPYIWLEIGAFWGDEKRIVGVLHGMTVKDFTADEKVPLILKRLSLLTLNEIERRTSISFEHALPIGRTLMASDKPRIFISYAEDDASLAEFIANQLAQSGIETWLDKKQLTSGPNWREELSKRLEEANLYVLLITPSYLKSRWTNFELGVALMRASQSKDVRILPLTLGVSLDELPSATLRADALSLDRNAPGDVRGAVEAALHNAVS
jgi:hypothetical protein